MSADHIIALRDDEFAFIQASFEMALGACGPCHCDNDPKCTNCDTVRRLLRRFAPVRGVCRVCLCTEEWPCATQDDMQTCGWANRERTLCDSPACLALDDGDHAIAAGRAGAA